MPVKPDGSMRHLVLPVLCVEMLEVRRVRMGAPLRDSVFPNTEGGWRDRGIVGKAIRRVRAETEFDRLTPHA